MRNILMTVMLIIVVVAMFTSIVTSPDGLQDQIEAKGTNAIDLIEGLTAGN